MNIEHGPRHNDHFRPRSWPMLWLQLGLLLLMLGPTIAPAAGADSEPLSRLRAARKTAAERSRRIIFNNDGDEPIYQCRETSTEELLKHRTAPLAGSQVDTIFYCTCAGFGLFTHGTKLGHVFATHEGRFSTNVTDKYIARRDRSAQRHGRLWSSAQDGSILVVARQRHARRQRD
jgi:hypothetical protein